MNAESVMIYFFLNSDIVTNLSNSIALFVILVPLSMHPSTFSRHQRPEQGDPAATDRDGQLAS